MVEIYEAGQGSGRSLSSGQGKRQLFRAERGSGQNPRGGARQWSFPFRTGQKQREPTIKCQFQGLFEQVSIFLSFLLVSFLGQGRAGQSSVENFTWRSRLFPCGWGSVCIRIGHAIYVLHYAYKPGIKKPHEQNPH